MKAVAGNMCPRCHALMSEPHAVWCATLDNVIAVGNTTPLQAEIDRLRAELAEARKPDCNRCRRYHRHGFGEGVCANTLIGEPACVNGDGFREADPVRLYEIAAAMVGGAHGDA